MKNIRTTILMSILILFVGTLNVTAKGYGKRNKKRSYAYGYIAEDSCVYLLEVAHDTTNIPFHWEVVDRPTWHKKFYYCQIDWIGANAAALVNQHKNLNIRKKVSLNYLNITKLSIEKISERKFLISSRLEYPSLFHRNHTYRYWVITLNKDKTQYTVTAISRKNIGKARRIDR